MNSRARCTLHLKPGACHHLVDGDARICASPVGDWVHFGAAKNQYLAFKILSLSYAGCNRETASSILSSPAFSISIEVA